MKTEGEKSEEEKEKDKEGKERQREREEGRKEESEKKLEGKSVKKLSCSFQNFVLVHFLSKFFLPS